MLFNRIQIERDSNCRKIENSVYERLANIVKPQEQKLSNDFNVKIISVEDALRELIEIEKSQRDRTAG